MKLRHAFLLAALATLTPACTLLFPGPEQDTEAEGLDVVDDKGPFDPSEAVDDDAEPRADDLGASPTTGSAEEDVASEAEAERREDRRAAARERANASGAEDQIKPQLARNPEPEPPGAAEPWWSTAVDWVGETAVLLAIAALVTALLRAIVGAAHLFHRVVRRPKTATTH